ncbi:MAG: hypothetical protein HYR60_07920 [Acidobacteria bacterium]|nr:hypothetical protein [Acidobacteriota bacterium]
MVNVFACPVIVVALGLLAPALGGAQSSDLERRVLQLEEKMRKLDPAFGRDAPVDLLSRLEALERKMERLLQAPAEPAPPAVSPLQPVSVSGDYQASKDAETRLPVSGYMDFHFNKNRGDPGQFDFHRFVLLFGHSFSDRIKFWSELELEHALVEGGEEKGEVALEQAYLDFLIKPYFNLRAGMLLTPVGLVNERHEPPSFNGVERPFVETVIIPTTWREMGFGATGDLGRGFRYRAYLMSSLNAARFDARQGIGGGKTNGFEASFRNPAKVGRLEYVGLRRLALGTSFYSGHAGFDLHRINPRINIFSVDGRYGYRRLEFRGLFANTWISRSGELNASLERTLGRNPNIGSQLRGAYFEPAVHLFPRRLRQDLIVFTRYEKYNTQHRMPKGFVSLPQFDRWSWVAGATYKPNADVAIKFDYNFNRNASSVIRVADTLNLGIGWWF